MRSWVALAVAVLCVPAVARAQETTTTVLLDTTTTTAEVPTTMLPPTTTTVVTTTTQVPVCDPANLMSCDDGNPCTIDSCMGALIGCTHHPLDGTPCPDDGIFCTDDRCEAGVCQHPPSDMRCDRGDCVLRTCDPTAEHTDRQGCVLLQGRKKIDGAPCTDDGFACTEDACMEGVCLHFPIGVRCLPQGECTAAACAPTRPGHDADGCAIGPPRGEGQPCADDGDVCTADVCRAGACTHEPETDMAECSPLQDTYRQSTGLGTVAGEIRMELPESGPPVISTAAARLTAIEAQFDAAAAVLAGLTGSGPAPAAAFQPADIPSVPVAQRARIAFTMVLRTPHDVQAFLQTLAQARAQAALARPTVRHLRRRGRALLRSARMLRASLRTLAAS
jgi:hypothetical protein